MRFYKLLLFKEYFDKGAALTYYFKYLIAFYGISSLHWQSTIGLGIIYGFLCFFLGYFWYKFKLIDAEYEVHNQFDPFVKEVRHEISGGKFFKL